MRWRATVLLAALALGAVAGAAAGQAAGQPAPGHAAPQPVCVVVRTYWGHAGRPGAGLREMLLSLQRQAHPEWEAVLVVMDSQPFPELARIVQGLGDERVWVFADWVGAQFQPKTGGAWSPLYHKRLYELTDEAIRACSPHTRWVLVTNGDNQYAASAFTELAATPHADLVAFNFYSRYQRVTGPPCDRFAHQPGLPACKPNLLRWCHTDLGANAMSWPRLVAEDRRFGALADQDGKGAEHLDGVMAEALVSAGWTVHRADACLFEHDPSPQRCAQAGGVWDDTLELALSSPGGDCIPQSAADKLLAEADVQEVSVQLSRDAHLELFQAAEVPLQTHIRCLRDSDTRAARQRSRSFFGEGCAHASDL